MQEGLVTCLAYSSALTMEAIWSSKASVYSYQTVRRKIPEDNSLHSHCFGNLISNIFSAWPPTEIYQFNSPQTSFINLVRAWELLAFFPVVKSSVPGVAFSFQRVTTRKIVYKLIFKLFKTNFTTFKTIISISIFNIWSISFPLSNFEFFLTNPVECRYVVCSPAGSHHYMAFSDVDVWLCRGLFDRQDSLRSDYMSDRESRYGIVQQASIESTDSRLCYLTSSEVGKTLLIWPAQLICACAEDKAGYSLLRCGAMYFV
jgi:hypothetical protein